MSICWYKEVIKIIMEDTYNNIILIICIVYFPRNSTPKLHTSKHM